MVYFVQFSHVSRWKEKKNSEKGREKGSLCVLTHYILGEGVHISDSDKDTMSHVSEHIYLVP